MSGNEWLDRLVAVADEEKGTDFKFVAADAPSENAQLIPDALHNSPTGSIAEVCPGARSLAGDFAERIALHGGGALIIDYGPATSAIGDSLQAALDHEYHPVLMTPGKADLTAHVDFASLMESARERSAATWGPITQGQFLQNLGIQTRARSLMDGAAPKEQLDIMSAMQRLIHPDHMGELFKVVGLTGAGQPSPPGFSQ